MNFYVNHSIRDLSLKTTLEDNQIIFFEDDLRLLNILERIENYFKKNDDKKKKKSIMSFTFDAQDNFYNLLKNDKSFIVVLMLFHLSNLILLS